MQAMPSPKMDIPVPESLIGLIVDGRYEIIAKLGEGGIGAVFLARDRRMMNRSVVIKVLLDNWLDNPEIRRKFEHEKEALSRLDHPGIVSIHDAGSLSDKIPYLVMPYAPGLTLENILREEPTPPLAFCSAVILAVADALSAAHSKGILHRDVKPENIIVDRSAGEKPRVRLIDFGIARVFDSRISPVTLVERSIGTVWFVAPEQLLGNIEQTTAADVFSLAVVAYLMLTGQRPFDPQTVVEMAVLHKEGPKRLPSQINKVVSSEVDDVIGRALQYDPAQRISDVAAFGKMFSEALHRLGKTTAAPITVENAQPPPTHSVPAEESAPPKNDDGVESVKTWLPLKEPSITLPAAAPRRRWLPAALVLAMSVILIGAVAAAGFIAWRNYPTSESLAARPIEPQPQPAVSKPSGPALRISFTVRAKGEAIPRSMDVPSVQRVSFRNGDKLFMTVEATQTGNLYIFNEDDLGQEGSVFNFLFPNEKYQDGIPRAEKGKAINVNEQTFRGEPGVEVVWFFWTSTSVPELEEARINAFSNFGKVRDSHRIKALSQFLAGQDRSKTKIESDNETTTIYGSDQLIVYRVELEHR